MSARVDMTERDSVPQAANSHDGALERTKPGAATQPLQGQDCLVPARGGPRAVFASLIAMTLDCGFRDQVETGRRTLKNSNMACLRADPNFAKSLILVPAEGFEPPTP